MKNPKGSSGIAIEGGMADAVPGARNMHPVLSPAAISGLVKGPDTLPSAPPSVGGATRDSVLDVKGQYKGTGN